MALSNATVRRLCVALLIGLSSAQGLSHCFGINSICTISQEMYDVCSASGGSGSSRNVTAEFACFCEGGWVSVLQACDDCEGSVSSYHATESLLSSDCKSMSFTIAPIPSSVSSRLGNTSVVTTAKSATKTAPSTSNIQSDSNDVFATPTSTTTTLVIAPTAISHPLGRLNPPVPGRIVAEDRTAVYSAFFLSEFHFVVPEHGAFFVDRFRRALGLVKEAEGALSKNPLVHAVGALASGHFSRQHNDVASQSNSMLAYGNALRCTAEQLANIHQESRSLVSDQDWEDLHLCCLSLAMWEFCMRPGAHDWRNHVQGMASAMEQRGIHRLECPAWACSSRFFVLLERLDSAGKTGAKKFELVGDNSDVTCYLWPSSKRDTYMAQGPRTTVDSTLDDLAAAVAIRAQLSRLSLAYNHPERHARGGKNLDAQLARILTQGTAIIQRREIFLHFCGQSVSEISMDSLLSKASKSRLAEAILSVYPFRSNSSIPATVLYFSNLREYYNITIGWLTVMVTRLVQCDAIRLMKDGSRRRSILGIDGLPDSEMLERSFHRHRAALVDYALLTFRTIPYITLAENIDTSPFFTSAVFNLAHFIVAHECEIRSTDAGSDGQLDLLLAARDVLENHLKWVSSRKITIAFRWGDLPRNGMSIV
ncbi:hypothetical protein GQ53DRAFT_823705 [Thozetella sp. PMI_491]|nr:hypothetical protein GQ53DRAFT_823705 [Thozetella sp. PMI_491]